MIFKLKNPWGVTQEVQRTDLWRVGLDELIDILRKPDGVAVSAYYTELVSNFPTSSEAVVYATKITLPESTIATRSIIQGAQAVNLPGYDEPISPTRIDFLHEIPGQANQKEIAKLAARSKIYSLLQAWALLVKTGQQRFGAKAEMPLVDHRKIPRFTADLLVQFYKGGIEKPSLDLSTALVLKRCWISDLQLGDLDYTNGRTLLQIVATVQCASVLPVKFDATA